MKWELHFTTNQNNAELLINNWEEEGNTKKGKIKFQTNVRIARDGKCRLVTVNFN